MLKTGAIPSVIVCVIAALFGIIPPEKIAIAATPPEQVESGVSGELLVFAAISLREPLLEMIAAFSERYPRIEVRLHAGASGLLARQVERGAPADLFLSAAPVEIDRLDAAGLLQRGSRVVFGGNRLVIAVARGTEPPASFGQLADPRFDRIAIGNPRTVPAGRYADETLRSAGLYDALADRLVPAENARQVLDYVVRGETTAGLVYRTDARLADGKIALGPEAPANAHAPILYEAAIPIDTGADDIARPFLDFLISARGQAVLSRFGFLPAPAR